VTALRRIGATAATEQAAQVARAATVGEATGEIREAYRDWFGTQGRDRRP